MVARTVDHKQRSSITRETAGATRAPAFSCSRLASRSYSVFCSDIETCSYAWGWFPPLPAPTMTLGIGE